MDKHSTEITEGQHIEGKEFETADERSEEDLENTKKGEPDNRDENETEKFDNVKEGGVTVDDGNIDSRFKTLFSEAADQLAKSIRLKKFEEKFTKSLLIRSAVKESMGKNHTVRFQVEKV